MATKNKYKLAGVVGVSAYTIVVAESEEEAKDIASGRDVVLADHGTEEDSWLVEDADGMVKMSDCTCVEEDVEDV